MDGGLYVHVPFCRRVCPYCDFAVRTGDAPRRRRFVERLIEEIALHAGDPLGFDTVYFGGGTPSLLAAEDLARILAALRRDLAVLPGARVFLEANPEDVTSDAVRDWRAAGIDVLSLGVQSLDAQALRWLGRGHDPAAARRAVEAALGAGFATVSIDLIYCLPGQRPDTWRRELDRALALGIEHLSCYELTIHERTRFGLLARRGQLAPLDEELRSELFRETHRHLNERGMAGYEVSNFAAAPEHRSRHNVKYWRHAPYLGLGPAAHSFRERRRTWNVRRTDDWEARVAAGERPLAGAEELDARALTLEALLLGLRTYDGVELDRVRERFGVDPFATNAALLARLVDAGLVRLEGSRLVPTLDGLAVADSLVPLFDLDAQSAADARDEPR